AGAAGDDRERPAELRAGARRCRSRAAADGQAQGRCAGGETQAQPGDHLMNVARERLPFGAMTTAGIVSPGAMGSAVGGVLRRGGARVVVTVAGRSERTGRLARDAGLELVPSIADVVAAADVVLSIVP